MRLTAFLFFILVAFCLQQQVDASADSDPFTKLMRDWIKRDFERGVETRDLIDQLRLRFPSKQDQDYLDKYLVKYGISPNSVFKVKSVVNREMSVDITLQNGRKLTLSRFTPETVDVNGKTLKIKGVSAAKYLHDVHDILRATSVASNISDLVFPSALSDYFSDAAHGSMWAQINGSDPLSQIRTLTKKCKAEISAGIVYDKSDTKQAREIAEKHQGELAEVFKAVFPASSSICPANCTKFAASGKKQSKEFQVDQGRKDVCDVVAEFRVCAESLAGDGGTAKDSEKLLQ